MHKATTTRRLPMTTYILMHTVCPMYKTRISLSLAQRASEVGLGDRRDYELMNLLGCPLIS